LTHGYHTLLDSRVHGKCDWYWYLFVHYEEIKRDLNRILINDCRCDERLRSKTEGCARLTYTGLSGGLEHLKIETRLIDERFESVMGECVIWRLQVNRLYSK
jgi:hypothetical protein